MTETQPSVSSVALKFGLMGAIVSIIYTAILLVLGVNVSGWVGALGYVILIAFMVIAMREYKNRNHGYMSYGQGLGMGTLVAVVFGVIGGIFMFIYTSFIDTEYTSKLMDQQRIELEERGMSDDQIEQAIAMGESFSSPVMMIVWSIVGYLVIGFLISLIVSAVMKNSKPEFE